MPVEVRNIFMRKIPVTKPNVDINHMAREFPSAAMPRWDKPSMVRIASRNWDNIAQ